jgi:hypothetical protein
VIAGWSWEAGKVELALEPGAAAMVPTQRTDQLVDLGRVFGTGGQPPHPAKPAGCLQVPAGLRLRPRGPSIPDLLIAATAEKAALTVLAADKDLDLIAAVTGQPGGPVDAVERPAWYVPDLQRRALAASARSVNAAKSRARAVGSPTSVGPVVVACRGRAAMSILLPG